MKTRPGVLALLSLSLALLPVYGKTYKSTLPVPCGEVWTAVKDTLSNPENYNVTASDDSKMTADYHVKHSVHVNVTGTILQRTNHVTLIPKDSACEMHVVSNFSGWEHNDREDFKKRVDESLAKAKNAAKPPEANK
jgi:glycerol-3-phosphate dehydrogenase